MVQTITDWNLGLRTWTRNLLLQLLVCSQYTQYQWRTPGSKFFKFPTVFGKFWQNRMLATPLPRGFAPARWRNPRSVTEYPMCLQTGAECKSETWVSKTSSGSKGRVLGTPPRWSNFYRPKRSFGQGNIFTPICHSVKGGGSTWPGTPPGTRQVPPRPGRYPPDQAGTPPWTRQVHPQGGTPPWTRQVQHPRPGRYTPLGTRQVPPGPGRYTPPGDQVHPPDQAGTLSPWTRKVPPLPPPEAADPGIRSTIGRYASYWNAFLFNFHAIFYENFAK